MNYMEIEKVSVSNGKGFRVVLYVSGCSIHCHNCHNPESWDFNAGKKFTEHSKQKMFEALDKEWVKGLTVTGGHPLEKQNIWDIIQLLNEVRQKFPQKDIWLYTGYTLQIDDFASSYDPVDIVTPHKFATSLCDYIVDGPYIDSKRDLTLAFRGSSNQRIIDVKKTIEGQKIITYEC